MWTVANKVSILDTCFKFVTEENRQLTTIGKEARKGKPFFQEMILSRENLNTFIDTRNNIFFNFQN